MSARSAPSRWRPVLVLVALLVLVAPLAACGGSTLGAGTAVGPVPSPELRQFYAQRLDWSRCGRFDCTYLEVPLDYSRPTGRTARLAVLRSRAGRPDRRIGSLVVNPGGPGGSGTQLAAGLADQIRNTPLGQRFDLVGFDPRGIGSSEPLIKCSTGRERDDDRLYRDTDDAAPPGETPAEAAERARARDAHYEEETKGDVAKCVERSGADLLANVGTRDVARDMDVLRSALGDTKLTYLGYSYGTRLGYTYAEAFPGNVRALVLDGALDPNQDPVDESVAQAGAFQRAFEVFAAWCAQQPSCPLGADAADPRAATANYRTLVLPLLRQPVELRDGRKLAYGDAQTAVIKAMYQRELWVPLRHGLEELVSGKGEVLMRLADAYYERSGHGEYSNLQDALRAVRCVDDQAITDPAVALEESRRTLAVAPFEDDGQGPSAARDACAFWPVPPTSRAHQPNVAGLPPVVVVSTTGDPATPYQAGVELAKALHGRLISVQGNQHGASLSGNQCVDGAVTRYLTDLELPPDGIRCTLDPS